MATTFTGTIKVSLTGTLEKTFNEGGPAKYPLSYSKSYEFTNGAGAGQANMCYANENTSLSASGTDSIDLAGSLSDAFGDTITFTSIKAILIVAASTNGDNLVLGGNANAFESFFNNAGDELLIAPGGCELLVNDNANGFAVTASTGDILDITNADSGAAASYEIYIVGEV